jgi:hypothetical protein
VGGEDELNAWKALWTDEDGARKYRRFEGDRPSESGAVSFAKDLRRRGLAVEVISVRHAYPPPEKMKRPDRPGLLWCPYCVKWREFSEAIVVHPDYRTPELLRCTICTISIRDAYVRRYNPEFAAKYDVEQELKARARKQKIDEKKLRTIKPRKVRA